MGRSKNFPRSRIITIVVRDDGSYSLGNLGDRKEPRRFTDPNELLRAVIEQILEHQVTLGLTETLKL